jgi:NDP-sugar pyrophosphorylase family protein
MVQVLVLAGGLGTRLWPRTATVPKALVPVAGRPFAEHQIELLTAGGVDDIVFAVAHRGDMIRRALGDGRRWNVRVRYSDEGADLRGTGGAVRLFATSELADEVFAVLYGDSYLPIDYQAVWEAYGRCGAPALITVLENHDHWDTSNAAFAANRRVRYCKGAGVTGGMSHIDYGLSVLARDLVLERIPAGGPSDLANLFTDLGEHGELAGYEVADRFYEIGSDNGVADLEALLSGRAGVEVVR